MDNGFSSPSARLSAALATLAVALAGAACGLPKVEARAWFPADPAAVQRARAEKDHEGVYLRLEEEDDLYVNAQNRSLRVERQHARVLVLSEAFSKVFKITFVAPKGRELSYFEARIIKPGGRVIAIGQDQVTKAKIDEAADDPDEDRERHTLALPMLEAGDVVEYRIAAATKQDWRSSRSITFGRSILMQRSLPVREFVHRHTLPDAWKVRYKVYNDATPVRERVADGRRTYELIRRDLPALPRTQWRPPTDSHAARITWRIDTYDIDFPQERPFTWDEETRDWERRFLTAKADLAKDFSQPIFFTPSDSATAKIARAFDYVRKLKWGGWSTLHARPAKDIRPLAGVLKRGSASNYERAALLSHLLTIAGVAPRPLLVRLARTGPIDPAFPMSGRFNHAAVWVPASETLGIPRGIVLDPSCQWCAPGELPGWSQGTIGLVLHGDFAARPVELRGQDAPPSLHRRELHLRLAADGSAEGTLRILRQGAAALGLQARLHASTDAARTELAGKIVRGFFPSATVATPSHTLPADPKEKLVWTIKFKAAGVAQSIGATTVVPLAFLRRPELDNRRVSKTRGADLWREVSLDLEDRVEIEGPPGFAAEVLPAKQLGAPLIRYEESTRSEGHKFLIERTAKLGRGIAQLIYRAGVRRVIDAAGEILRASATFTKK